MDVSEKQCFKCKETFPLEEGFHKHPGMKDGHLNKCKKCTKADVIANYRSKIEYYREYDKNRNTDQKRKDLRMDYQKRSRMENPQKYLARQTAERALKDGRLTSGPCHFCESVEDIEMHHVDYSQPLKVYWLCKICHRKLDNMLKLTKVE